MRRKFLVWSIGYKCTIMICEFRRIIRGKNGCVYKFINNANTRTRWALRRVSHYAWNTGARPAMTNHGNQTVTAIHKSPTSHRRITPIYRVTTSSPDTTVGTENNTANYFARYQVSLTTSLSAVSSHFWTNNWLLRYAKFSFRPPRYTSTYSFPSFDNYVRLRLSDFQGHLFFGSSNRPSIPPHYLFGFAKYFVASRHSPH